MNILYIRRCIENEKKIIIIPILLTLIFVLAACGDNDTNNGEDYSVYDYNGDNFVFDYPLGEWEAEEYHESGNDARYEGLRLEKEVEGGRYLITIRYQYSPPEITEAEFRAEEKYYSFRDYDMEVIGEEKDYRGDVSIRHSYNRGYIDQLTYAGFRYAIYHDNKPHEIIFEAIDVDKELQDIIDFAEEVVFPQLELK